MKIITIDGSEDHLFKEGSGYIVNFKNKLVNKSNNNFTHRRRFNSHRISAKFEPINIKNEIIPDILDQKNTDLFREDSSFKTKPFSDTTQKFVKQQKRSSFLTKNYGSESDNELLLEIESEPYHDKPNLVLSEFVNLSEEDVQNFYYPLQFNLTSFHKRSGRIDIFNTLNKIELSSFGVDKIKGVRGFTLNTSSNAIGENLIIKNYFDKKEINSFPFEDGLIEGIVYNDSAHKILDNITYTYNPITKKTSNVNASFKLVNKTSTEPRFVTFELQKITPFSDIDNNKNNPNVSNSNYFYFNRLSDSEMNDILLNNYQNYNVIEEERLYASAGKIIDYTQNNGIDSFTFYEGLD